MGIHGDLNSGRDVDLKRNGRWIVDVERANTRDDGEASRAVNMVTTDIEADEGDQDLRRRVDVGDGHRPTEADAAELFRQTAGERRDLPGPQIDA